MMISWRLCLLFAVIFYSKSAMSCSYDSQCSGSKTCCSDGLCRSDCSGAIGSVVVGIIVVCVIIGKIIFWVVCCYCWRRRQAPTVVIARTTQMTPTVSQGYPPPPSNGYASYPSSSTTSNMFKNQNDIIAYPRSSAPPQEANGNPGYDSLPQTILSDPDHGSNPPPPYTPKFPS